MFEHKKVESFDGTKIVYMIKRVKNSKKTILFLHGAWSNKSIWTEWFPFFSDATCIALDFRCRGESERGELTVMNDTKDINAVVEKEKIKQVNIIGNSYGAVVAYSWYQKNKEKVKKMVLFGLFAQPFLRCTKIMRFKAKCILMLTKLFPKRKKIIPVYYPAHKKTPSGFMIWHDLKALYVSDLCEAIIELTKAHVDLKSIKVSTLLVEGSSDIFIKTKKILEEVKKNNALQCILLKGQHRLIIKEKPSLIKKIKEFIA